MAILQCLQRGLRRPHHHYCEGNSDQRPKHRMHPQWWRETKLDPEGKRHHHCAEHQDDTDSRAIAGVMRAQIEIADLAAVANVQQSTKQPALPAAWATTGQRNVQK